MNIREILTEGLSKKDTFSILHDFVSFAANHLELKTLPKFDFIFDSKNSVNRKSFGGYGDRHITITELNPAIAAILIIGLNQNMLSPIAFTPTATGSGTFKKV